MSEKLIEPMWLGYKNSVLMNVPELYHDDFREAFFSGAAAFLLIGVEVKKIHKSSEGLQKAADYVVVEITEFCEQAAIRTSVWDSL